MSGRSHPQGSGPTPPSASSFPVNAATTPGTCFAFETSTRRRRACACGLRTKTAYACPGSFTSSVNTPLPVIRRGSSRRLMLEPKSFAWGMPASLLHLLGRVLDGADDVVVAGAAAQVPLELMPDVGLARALVALQDLVGGHDHARGAEPALEPVLLPEALLDGVELAVLGEALDGEDVVAVGLDG